MPSNEFDPGYEKLAHIVRMSRLMPPDTLRIDGIEYVRAGVNPHAKLIEAARAFRESRVKPVNAVNAKYPPEAEVGIKTAVFMADCFDAAMELLKVAAEEEAIPFVWDVNS